VWQYLHKCQIEVQEPAGVRVLARRLAAAAVAALAIGAPTTICANVEDCEEAIRAFTSARNDIASAYRAYGLCLSGSDGHDDCSTEFSRLRSSQSTFETAVYEYQNECE
jgi:hypothetical protein